MEVQERAQAFRNICGLKCAFELAYLINSIEFCEDVPSPPPVEENPLKVVRNAYDLKNAEKYSVRFKEKFKGFVSSNTS